MAPDRHRWPRIALPLALAVLVAAWMLRDRGIEPLATWFYVFAWYPTLLALDAVAVLLGGESLLARPVSVLALLWWSAVIWFLFELLNLRLQNWYYVLVPPHRLERWVGITVSFATVGPAILLPERLLDRLGLWHALRGRPLPLGPRDLTLSAAVGGLLIAAILWQPRYLFPLVWGAVWLLAEPLLYRTDPQRSLFGDISRGEWGRITRLVLAGLVAGILWEAYNTGDRGKWVYTVPFLEELKVFEMPLLGFLGFPFFALELWSLYHLLAPRTNLRTTAVSVAFAIAVLIGIDRWTVSSTLPRLAEVPGVRAVVAERLEAAGLADAFRLASTPPQGVARRAGIDSSEAVLVHERARLVVFRGIGTRHAATLVAAGIHAVGELARADPEDLWRRVHAARPGQRPTLGEVRVWVSAAARAGAP